MRILGYINNYASIFSNGLGEIIPAPYHMFKGIFDILIRGQWGIFLDKYIVINGIPSVKEQVEKYIEDIISDYISYAKLASFYKS